MLFIPDSLELEAPWLTALAPKPQVFVNANFYYKKILRLYTDDMQVVDIDFESNSTWPFKNTFFAAYYPVLRTLDRPTLVNYYQWKRYVNFFICEKKGDVFIDSFMQRKYVKVQAYIRNRNHQWIKVKELKCKA